MTEPGDATGRQYEKTPNTRRAPRFFPGSLPAAVVAREQKRCGRTPPASDAWTTAIGFAGGKRPPGKIRSPRSGQESEGLCEGVGGCEGCGLIVGCLLGGKRGKAHVLYSG